MGDEFRLWGAVLDRALRDLREPGKRDDAMAWIESERVGEGSFRFVCDILQANPDWVRRKIRNFDRQRSSHLDIAA